MARAREEAPEAKRARTAQAVTTEAQEEVKQAAELDLEFWEQAIEG